MDEEMSKCLRKPFPEKEVQIKPGQGGLRYISHGSITARLLDCDPAWTAEVLQEYQSQDGKIAALRMALTVGGVTRIEVGGPQRSNGLLADLKNGYSDVLKRCAMRFGVALEMWEDLIDAQDDEDHAPSIATSHVARSNPSKDTLRPVAPQTRRADPVEAAGIGQPSTQRQQQYGVAVAREAGITPADLDELSRKHYGRVWMRLMRDEASHIIDMIQNPVEMTAKDAVEENKRQAVSSKQDPEDPNSVLPTKRREDFISAIFNHTKGQVTATDLNNIHREGTGNNLPSITVAESRTLYTWVLNANEYELVARRDELRRQYQPITDTLRKKFWAVVGKHTPPGVEKENYAHVQLYEHLGLGSVNDMSTYDVDKMISVYEGQNFLDPAPEEGSDDVGPEPEPPF